jgi:hypothetical protein
LGFPTGWSFTTHKETSGAINHTPASPIHHYGIPSLRHVFIIHYHQIDDKLQAYDLLEMLILKLELHNLDDNHHLM